MDVLTKHQRQYSEDWKEKWHKQTGQQEEKRTKRTRGKHIDVMETSESRKTKDQAIYLCYRH